MNKHILVFCSIALSAALHSHTLTIDSQYATSTWHENNMYITHGGKVRIASPALGTATSNKVLCHLCYRNGTVIIERIVARNVTLRYKTGILTAKMLEVVPSTQICIARGDVRITHQHAHAYTGTLHAESAMLNLKTHALHTHNSQYPVNLQITSAKPYEAHTHYSSTLDTTGSTNCGR